MSVEQKIREVMDELQAQVIDGYAGPVNGWSTLKDEATQAILQIIESDANEQEKRVWELREKAAELEINYWYKKLANLREDK